jgi:hypothetical protein
LAVKLEILFELDLFGLIHEQNRLSRVNIVVTYSALSVYFRKK